MYLISVFISMTLCILSVLYIRNHSMFKEKWRNHNLLKINGLSKAEFYIPNNLWDYMNSLSEEEKSKIFFSSSDGSVQKFSVIKKADMEIRAECGVSTGLFRKMVNLHDLYKKQSSKTMNQILSHNKNYDVLDIKIIQKLGLVKYHEVRHYPATEEKPEYWEAYISVSKYNDETLGLVLVSYNPIDIPTIRAIEKYSTVK